MSKNPYLVGQVVHNPDMFFGRRIELAHLRDHIRVGHSVSITGLPWSGKSSLLYQLVHQIKNRSDSSVFVYLDLNRPNCQSVSGLLTYAAKELDKRLDRRYRFGTIQNIQQFTELVARLRTDGFRPVLCLDDIDQLMSYHAFDEAFFEAWRYLGSMGEIVFVTTSRHPLEKTLIFNDQPSSFYNIFSTIQLSSLSRADGRLLLRDPFRRAPKRKVPSPALINAALNITGGHPYFIQVMGFLLWEDNITMPEDLEDPFKERAWEPMGQLWHELTLDEKEIAQELAAAERVIADWNANLQALIRLGIAERNPQGKVHLFSPIFREGIRSGEWEEDSALLANGIAKNTPSYSTPTQLYAHLLILLFAALIAAFGTIWLTLEREMTIALFAGTYLLILALDTLILERRLMAWLTDLAQGG